MANSLMTDVHFNWMLQKSFGGSGSISSTSEPYPSLWKIGISNTTPSSSDTNLNKTVPYTSTNLDDCDAVTGWTEGGDGQAVVLNTSGMNEGTGCLNTPITYSVGTSSWYKAMSGTVNLSSSGIRLYVWIYIDDLTLIASGSDGVSIIITDENATFTDYSQWDFNKTDLSAGWNTLIVSDLNSPDSYGTNSADLTIIKTLKLQIKTTGSFVSDSLRMDAWHYATKSQHEKSSESNYPVLNTTLHTITDLTVYSTSQANGYKIQEVGWVNSNSKLHNHGIFTYVNKDSGKELRVMSIFRWKNE